MLLTDNKIHKLGKTILAPFREECVQTIGYDLRTASFYSSSTKESKEITLEPMESTFVQCEESISLPANISASVTLRNSRIRQGLLLTAPVYYPGHNTPVYFRVTNVSAEWITLREGDGIATLLFEDLGEAVDHPYDGAFQHENKYRGMSDYSHVYQAAMSKVKDKLDALKSLEKGIYANVLAILAIFVAAFSIINVNVSLAKEAADLHALIVFNLCTIGSIAFLLWAVGFIVPKQPAQKTWLLLVVGCIAFIMSFML